MGMVEVGWDVMIGEMGGMEMWMEIDGGEGAWKQTITSGVGE